QARCCCLALLFPLRHCGADTRRERGNSRAARRRVVVALPAIATAAATAAAATTAVAAAATAAAAATTAAAAAGLALLGLVDAQRTAVELRAVHRLDRRLCVSIRRHLDEREAARAAGVAIEHDAAALDLAAIGAERGSQGLLCGVERKIAYVETLAHRTTF